MSNECSQLHETINKLQRYSFPFEQSSIPMNGVYILFQKGEFGHKKDRIVRVGTHTGENQLRSRLKQHFLNENKDRSIFRKNIGRAILNKNNDYFLQYWDIDLTTRKAKDKFSSLIDFDYQKKIEVQVSNFIQENFTFSVFEVASKEKRLHIESRIISTVSLCEECQPSNMWLGSHSPKGKIVKSGLWLVNELYKTPFNKNDIKNFTKQLMMG